MYRRNTEWTKMFEEERRIDEIEDAILDELYRPKAMNSRATMLPVHIYSILSENPNKPVTLNDIKKILFKRYELDVEKRTVIRYLHTLENEGFGVVYTKNGIYYNPEYDINL